MLSREYANRLENAPAAMGAALQSLRRSEGSNDPMHAVVFSRDRPLQLHGLISSYLHHFDVPPPMIVLYSVSREPMHKAYEDLRQEFANDAVRFQKEENFREDLLDLLESLGDCRLFFLVDDIVFIRPVKSSVLKSIPLGTGILSLRLGPGISYSYTRQLVQKVPDLNPWKDELLSWDWYGQEIDWGYGFSVDGHVFWAPEILTLAKQVSFQKPNSFESAMQFFAPYFASRAGYCFSAPRLVNIPCNRVQDEIRNVHGDLHQGQLLEYWNQGLRMDYEHLQNIETNSCHQEIAIRFRAAKALHK